MSMISPQSPNMNYDFKKPVIQIMSYKAQKTPDLEFQEFLKISSPIKSPIKRIPAPMPIIEQTASFNYIDLNNSPSFNNSNRVPAAPADQTPSRYNR